MSQQYDDDDEDDDRYDEDLDPHWLPGEEECTDDDNLLPENQNHGDCTFSTPNCEKKYLVFDSCLNKLLKRCPDCGDVTIQHERKTIGSMLSIKLASQWPHHLLGFTASGKKETLG